MSEFWKSTVITVEEHDAIFKNMASLLDEYDYRFSEYGLDQIIETWAENKADLIQHFKLHPNYLKGKFMIVFDHDYEREVDPDAGAWFAAWVLKQDILDTHPMYLLQQLVKGDRTVSSNLADLISINYPDMHIHAGEKTTRAVNKFCVYFGIDTIKIPKTNPVTGRVKDEGYNYEFAKYADAMSPLSIKRHTILSVNPLDYLTMSFGNSWASCHTIDKENRRGMQNGYQGMYSSGTLSYMLDEPSMVFYTVNASYDGNEYWNQPKINRQMFHWGEEKLIQGRLYPQSNDGHGDAYKPYREIVQKLVSEIYDFPNRWTVSKGTDNAGQYIDSEGTHYKDYNCYGDCTMSRIRNSENDYAIIVGHDPICPNCGAEHAEEDNILCKDCNGSRFYCEGCGCAINEYGARWVGGTPYCCECVTCCDSCNEYTLNSELTSVTNRYHRTEQVCPYCLREYYQYCDNCEEYYESDLISYVESENMIVCDDCLGTCFSMCDNCEEYFRDDSLIRDENDGLCRCRSCQREHEAEIAELESENTPRIPIGR